MEWLKHRKEIRRLRRQMEVERLERELLQNTCPHDYVLVNTSKFYEGHGIIEQMYDVFCPVCGKITQLNARNYAITINSQTKRNIYHTEEEKVHGTKEKELRNW